MKNVSAQYKTAQANPTAKAFRSIQYATRQWSGGSNKYVWNAFVDLSESSVVSVGPITAKLDTDRLNEFKISNVDLTVLNKNNEWNPRNGSIFSGTFVEPYWTKFRIYFGYKLEDGNVENTTMFVGVAVGFSVDAGGGTVKINIQGLEAILANANAELVSTLVSNETPSGTINSVNKDFVTLNPGVGIIENVQVNSVDNKPGTHYDITQLNEPTLGAKITFKAAPPTGQTVKVWYRYWKQDEKLEDLVVDLLTVADVETGAEVQAVTFPGGVDDAHVIDSQSDFSQGTTTDGDLTRYAGDLRIKLDASSNYELLDSFSDGNYTSNPVWTGEGGGASYSVSSGRLYINSTYDEGVISTPSNGAIVGTWEYKFRVDYINWGEPIDFNFAGETKFYNPISPFGPQYISGNWVSFWSQNTSPGTFYLRLYLNNTLVQQVDVNSLISYGNTYTIKIISSPSGLVNVYLDGTLRLSGSAATSPTANYIGISTGRGGFAGDSQSYFDDIYRPKNTLSATWTSQTFDMTATVSSFGTFISNVYTGAGTVIISTRTSTDGVTWDSWVDVAGGVVGSVVKRYVQIKVVLTMPSTSRDEPFVSYLRLNYKKTVTTIKLANFTGKTCYQAIQSLGAFSNYEWGFNEKQKFFFRQKEVSSSPVLALDYSRNLIELSADDYGYNATYSEVQATFGDYDIILKDSGAYNGPLKRYGRKRLTIDGGDLLISPDTDVASGIAAGLMATETEAKIKLSAKIKLTPWVDLSDTVSVDWGTEYVGFLCKVIGVRHDLEAMVTDLNLEQIV